MGRNDQRIRVFLAGCLLLACFVTSSTGWAETLGGTARLTLGQQRVFEVRAPLEQVAIGDPDVIDVKVISQGRQVLITAIGKGTTDLITWDLQGKQTTTLVYVILKDIRLIQREVRSMIGQVEGARTSLVGERVLIDGEVFTRSDLERVKQVAAVYPDEITMLVKMSPSVSRLLAAEITRALHKNGFADVRAEGIGDKIFLEGTVTQKPDVKAVEILAEAYFEPVVNMVGLEGRSDDLVLIDIQFIEMSRNLAEHIGVNWDDSVRFEVQNLQYTIDIIRSASDTGNIQLRSGQQAGATVNIKDATGFARTLAHPRLVCKSGEKAEFLAGGQVPYVVQGLGGGSVVFQDYGIILKITPIVHPDGRISASVEAENSALDYANAVQGYPAFSERRVNTFVTLAKDEVLALSGLVSQADTKGVDKVPGIGNFPILGELFKSRQFENDQSELVILLTAECLTPASKKNQEPIKSMQERYEKAEKKLDPSFFD